MACAGYSFHPLDIKPGATSHIGYGQYESKQPAADHA
jgi:hypothetical protein